MKVPVLPSTNARPAGLPLVFARLAWVVALFTALLALATAGLVFAGWPAIPSPDRATFAVTFILLPVYLAVGLVIVHFRPGNRIGWLFLVVALFFTLATFTREYALFANRAGTWPGVLLSAWLSLFVNASFFLWFILLNLLYPDGRLLASPAWRWLAWVTVAASLILMLQELIRPGVIQLYRWQTSVILPYTNPTGLVRLHALFERTEGVAWTVSLLCLLASGLAPLQRYRAGRGVERQQIKWLAFFWALALVILGLAALALAFEIRVPEPLSELLFAVLFIGLMGGFPVIVGLALLRYRLWDIDLIIRRTLIYGALTASLTAIYAVSVIFLQETFRTLTGNPGQSQPAIVISTLAVAALFNPLRKWVQARIDRRFFRRRYDAERVLNDFSASLRDEVDIEKLNAQLLAVVQETMQPERASLWLRETKKEGVR